MNQPLVSTTAVKDAVKNSAPAAAVETQEKELPQAKKKLSFGDKAFDIGVYALLGGVVNFGLSMWSGYEARYGRAAKTMEKWTQGLEKTGMSRNSAENTIMTTALMMGGNMLVLPIKGLENYRTEIVGSINKAAGCNVDESTQAPPPKQTWTSLIKGRVAAWLMVFGAFKGAVAMVGGEKFEQFEHMVAKGTCKTLGRPTHIAGQETKLYKYGRIGALDVFATTSAAILLYTLSRFFAKKDKKLGEEPVISSPELNLIEDFETEGTPISKPKSTAKAPVKSFAEIAPTQKSYESRALEKADTPAHVAF